MSDDILAELRDLKDGWDGYDGATIAIRALEIARVILNNAPAISPTSDGGVCLEWYVDGWEIGLAVEPEGPPHTADFCEEVEAQTPPKAVDASDGDV